MASFAECIGCTDQCGSGTTQIQVTRSVEEETASEVDLNFESGPYSSGGLTVLVKLADLQDDQAEEDDEKEEQANAVSLRDLARTVEADEEPGKESQEKKDDDDEDLEDCATALCGKLLDHHMDELEVMQKTWWCCYCCCCAGCGVGPRDPIRFKYRCVLCDGFCQSADLVELRDGICHCVWDCCGCHVLSQLPWRDQTPRCAICNRHFFGWHKKDDEGLKPSPEEAHSAHVFEHATHDLFNLLYVSFCGCALAPFDITQMETICKCCCCRAVCQPTVPSEEECCACLLSVITLHLQCRIPAKAEANPLCAVCGKKIRRKKVSGFVHHIVHRDENEAPKQQKMQGHDEFAKGVVTLADIPEFE